MKHSLITMNLGGNLHSASQTLNRLGLADEVLQLHCSDGRNSIVVLRVKQCDVPDVCARLGLNHPDIHTVKAQ